MKLWTAFHGMHTVCSYHSEKNNSSQQSQITLPKMWQFFYCQWICWLQSCQCFHSLVESIPIIKLWLFITNLIFFSKKLAYIPKLNRKLYNIKDQLKSTFYAFSFKWIKPKEEGDVPAYLRSLRAINSKVMNIHKLSRKPITCIPELGVLVLLPRSWISLDNFEFLAKILDFFICCQDLGFLSFLPKIFTIILAKKSKIMQVEIREENQLFLEL